MHALPILITLAYLSTASSHIIVNKGVAFHKLESTVAAQSSWKLAFVIKLDPYSELLANIELKLEEIRVKVYDLWDTVRAHQNLPFRDNVNSLLSTIVVEVENLKGTSARLGEEFQDTRVLSRSKRALIPIVGKALSWLFGTVSDDELAGIRTNIHQLYQNDLKMKHIVASSLSVIKIVQQEVNGNIEKINQVISALEVVDHEIKNVSQDIAGTQVNLNVYIQLDRLIHQVTNAINLAREYNTQIRLQLDMMTLGHLSPVIISPSNLKEALANLKERLDQELVFDLPYDPIGDIWQYYKTLSCVAYIENNNIVVITAIPLLDRSDKFHMYKVLNLAMPKQGTNNSRLVAKYDLEGSALVIDDRRDKFAILSEYEANLCVTSPELCTFVGPLYSVENSNKCIVNLFLNKTDAIYTSCSARVYLRSQLPIAQYISDGSWFITTSEPMQFAVVCENTKEGEPETISIEGPIGVVNLEKSCSAHSGRISLPAHHTGESTIDWKNPLQELIQHFKFGTTSWERLDFELPNTTHIKIPPMLQAHKQLPLQDLIDQVNLSEQPLVEMPEHKPLWPYVVGFVCIISLVGLCILCRRRLCRVVYRLRVKAQPVGRQEGTVRFYGDDRVEIHTEQAIQKSRRRNDTHMSTLDSSKGAGRAPLDKDEWTLLSKLYEDAGRADAILERKRPGNPGEQGMARVMSIQDQGRPTGTGNPQRDSIPPTESGNLVHTSRARETPIPSAPVMTSLNNQQGGAQSGGRRSLYPSLTKELGMSTQ